MYAFHIQLWTRTIVFFFSECRKQIKGERENKEEKKNEQFKPCHQLTDIMRHPERENLL